MKKVTGSWKVITAMKECPVCKNRYDTSIEVCSRDNTPLTEILVTTYPSPESANQQNMLSELQRALKVAALSNDLKRLREGYIQLANYHRKEGQLNQALAYFHKAELLEPGDALTTQLPAIVEIYLQQSRTDKAIELVRRIALLYGSAGQRNQAAEYFKHLITLHSSDLKWVREILAIIEASGLAFDSESGTTVALSPQLAAEDSQLEEIEVTAISNEEASPPALNQNSAPNNGAATDARSPNTAMVIPRITLANSIPPTNKIVLPDETTKPSPQSGPRSASGSTAPAEPLPTVNAVDTMRTPSGSFRLEGEVPRTSSGSFRITGDPSRTPSGSFRITGDPPRTPSGSLRITGEIGRLSFSDLIVMIVDDDEGVRDLLAEMVKEFGCQVVTAADGEDAIDKLQKTQPSFIISDVVMPRRDGYELFQYLESNESLGDIPFIFLTGRGEIDEKLRALEGGVEDYWLKPFDVEEINIRLRRTLQKVRLAGDVRGRLSEMPLPDLLQSLASGNKSGILHLSRSGRAGVIYIDQGRMIDAEFEDLKGKTAIYCLVNWCMEGGNFNFHSQKIDRNVVIKQSIQGVLMEAMRRHDEETRLIEQLPPGDVFMAVNIEDNPEFFSTDFSDETTRIIQLFDGTHSLKECLRCLQGDLETIQTVVALNKAGLLRIVDFGIQ